MGSVLESAPSTGNTQKKRDVQCLNKIITVVSQYRVIQTRIPMMHCTLVILCVGAATPPSVHGVPVS